MVSKERLAVGLQSCLGNLWKGDDFSDVTVVVEDTPFRCHRFILSACSGALRDQFNFKSPGNVAEVKGVSEKTFEVILNCVYTGEAGFTVDNILDIWSAADLLQISYLAKECQSFAIENTDVDNCFKILTHARMYSAQTVIDHSLEFMAKHFDQFRNSEYLLQFPFDFLYKIIKSDYLATDSESMVVDTVFSWLEYIPNDAGRLQMSRYNSYVTDSGTTGSDCDFSGNDKGTGFDDDRTRMLLVKSDIEVSYTNATRDSSDNTLHTIAYTSDIKATSEDATNLHTGRQSVAIDACEMQPSTCNKTTGQSLCGVAQTENLSVCDMQTASQSACDSQQTEFPSEKDEESTFSKDKDITQRTLSGGMKPDAFNCDYHNDVATDSKDREKYLLKLISACRLFLAPTAYLEKLLRSNRLLWLCRESYNAVLDALMYTLQVGRRHDTWPPAAVHRVSSSMRHVMVYVSGRKLVAYELNSQRKYVFATLPDNASAMRAVAVFDNTLCVMFDEKDGQKVLARYVTERLWEVMNRIINKYDPIMLIGHSNYVFSICRDINPTTSVSSNKTKGLYSDFVLNRCQYKYDTSTAWGTCCNLDNKIDNMIRFNHYVLAFCTTPGDLITTFGHVSVQCFNTQTDNKDTCTATMSGTSKGMISFTCQEGTCILQRDGSLWKIVGTDADNLQFKLISKLWSYDCDIKGCVVYQHTLFVFYSGDDQQTLNIGVSSIDGIYTNTRTVKVSSNMSCLPMVIPASWQNTTQNIKPANTVFNFQPIFQFGQMKT